MSGKQQVIALWNAFLLWLLPAEDKDKEWDEWNYWNDRF